MTQSELYFEPTVFKSFRGSEKSFPMNDENRNADMLDALADIAYEQEQAMHESEQSDWDGVEDISVEERNACDHYNERYVHLMFRS